MLLLLLSEAPIAWGQSLDSQVTSDGQLQEIVVTAQKRSENLQTVPIAITALTGAELKQASVQDSSDLGRVAPGVVISQYGQSPNVTDIAIRGVAQLDFADHQESPNAVYVDGAYVSFQGAAGASLFDINRVEVLRGPQGTLFGRNATGGLVQIIANKPTDETAAYFEAQYGSYNSFRTEGATSGALSPTLDARFAFETSRQDGYITNVLGGHAGGDNTYNARVQLQWKPTDGFEDLINFHGSYTRPVNGGIYDIFSSVPDAGNHSLDIPATNAQLNSFCQRVGFGSVAPNAINCLGAVRPSNNPYVIASDRIGFYDRDMGGVTNTLTWRLPAFTITGITDYLKLNKGYEEDTDSTSLNYINYFAYANEWQASQELRAAGESGPLRWVTGAYYLHIQGDYQGYLTGAIPVNYDVGGDYRQWVNTGAIFAQSDYSITPSLTATLGARYTKDYKTLEYSALCNLSAADCAGFEGGAPDGTYISGGYKDSEWSGKFGLQWQIEDLMTYASVSRGTKGALLEAPLILSPGTTFAQLVIKPEVLTDYEIGVKSMFLDNRVRLNVSAFDYVYHNFQAYALKGISQALFNANAKESGGELELTALAAQGLTLSLGAAYLNSTVHGVQLPDGTIADQQAAFAPKFSVNGGARYEHRVSFGTLFGGVRASYSSSRFASTVNDPAINLPAYTLVDLSAGWTSESKKWSFTATVKNVGNEYYYVNSFDLTGSGGFTNRVPGLPRWYSGQIRYDF